MHDYLVITLLMWILQNQEFPNNHGRNAVLAVIYGAALQIFNYCLGKML